MKACVIIPTLNERENITPLIEQILASDSEMHVLVVDDNSADGTGALVEEWEQSDRRVHVRRRPARLGYGSAIADGMQWALDRGAGLVLSMDADFSHDPKYLPAILQLAQERELVIGSRYVPGGGTQNWGLCRRLLSAGANLVARTLLGLPAHDCTGGFRCYQRHVMERAQLIGVRVEGYGYLAATLFRCHRAGLSIGEVPIVFVDRRFGKSKLSKRIIAEAVGVVLRLWWERVTGRRSARL